MLVDVACRRSGIVLAPNGSPYEAEGVLNPGIARDRNGKLLMYPRTVAAGNISRIGIVPKVSDVGTGFARHGFAIEPQAEYEIRTVEGGYGCEDPRVTFVAELDAYLMAYTAFGPHGPRIALAISSDGYCWDRLGRVEFADEALNHLPNKDAALFPEVVMSPAGIPSFAFYHRPMLPESANGQAPISLIRSLPSAKREAIAIAYVPANRARRDPQALCLVQESVRVVDVGEDWGRLKNGCGTPPVWTEFGWLSIFHGVDARKHSDGAETLFYRAGLLLHDLQRPHVVLFRSEPCLGPDTVDERIGTVNDVVFPTGIDVLADGRYDLYYGAADAKISRARLNITIDDSISRAS